jgi:UDP-glucose 4-epimerase
MDRIAAGQPPLILGDGLQTMDFVYITDIARANILAAQSDATDVVLNFASGTETSLRGLAETMLRVMGSDLEPEFGPARTVNNVSRRLADTSRAADAIGFRADVDLESGLRKLVDWWQSERGVAAG